jgi:hypothetical protein
VQNSTQGSRASQSLRIFAFAIGQKLSIRDDEPAITGDGNKPHRQVNEEDIPPLKPNPVIGASDAHPLDIGTYDQAERNLDPYRWTTPNLALVVYIWPWRTTATIHRHPVSIVD